VGIIVLKTAEESEQSGSLMHHLMENLHPSLQMRLDPPLVCIITK
jgi:hypothetical protein